MPPDPSRGPGQTYSMTNSRGTPCDGVSVNSTPATFRLGELRNTTKRVAGLPVRRALARWTIAELANALSTQVSIDCCAATAAVAGVAVTGP
jgi:hypothetical protein